MPLKVALIEFLRKLTPLFIQMAAQAILKDLGGFKLFLARTLVKYGGAEIIRAVDELKLQAVREASQIEAMKKAQEVISNPESTDEEIGEAYEAIYNAGRKP